MVLAGSEGFDPRGTERVELHRQPLHHGPLVSRRVLRVERDELGEQGTEAVGPGHGLDGWHMAP